MKSIIIYTKEKVYNFNTDLDKKYDYILARAHRENGPALIGYYMNGDIRYEKYYKNGKLHREDGPANIKYFKNGNINYQDYYLNDKYYSKITFNKEILKRKFQLI